MTDHFPQTPVDEFPIPAKLNLFIAVLQFVLLITLLLLSGSVENIYQLLVLSFLYGICMNSAYALLHEAEHNLLHPNKWINDTTGALLALFFPAPFHLIRQGHLGHHMRNRSDDEAFDFYFAGENPLWKFVQLYGVLTGFFWAVIALSNVLSLGGTLFYRPKFGKFDRPTEAFLETINHQYHRFIQIEAFSIFILHGCLIYFGSIPFTHYLVVLGGFGFMWSALQYVHHFGTPRDVLKGAKNLKTWTLLDKILLNHNWHLNHHLNPTVSWIYLPKLYDGNEFIKRNSLVLSYLKMWRGPRFTTERVKNIYVGRIIK